MPERETIEAEAVIAAVDARWGAPCASCETALIGHEIVLSMLMGHVDAARCGTCLASELGLGSADFLRRGAANVRRLDCYRAGWTHADRRLASEPAWPEDRLPASLRMDAMGEDGDVEERQEHLAPSRGTPAVPDASFDAGDMACGELVLKLRRRVLELPAGATLRVVATDPGAREDLPAWCRLTGHTLVAASPPEYLIRRRND